MKNSNNCVIIEPLQNKWKVKQGEYIILLGNYKCVLTHIWSLWYHNNKSKLDQNNPNL